MKFSRKTTEKLLAEAKNAVIGGTAILKKYFKYGFSVRYKGDIDPVTTADKKTEEFIINYLRRRFHDIGFLCEESCPKNLLTGTFWILDPLDGTVNFVHGCPIFSISLALYSDGEILIGLINDIMRNEIFWSVKGGGAYANGKKLKVSAVTELNRSLLVTGFPYYIKEKHSRVIKNFKNLVISAQGIRRLGSAALDMAYVAAGRFDGFWEEGLAPWDVAAGSLIVKEAGGKISDFYGQNDYLFGKMMVATNGHIHSRIIKILKG